MRAPLRQLERLLFREEFHERRGEEVRISRVGLAFQGETPRIGQDIGDRLSRVVHPDWAVTAGHDERWYRDIRPLSR